MESIIQLETGVDAMRTLRSAAVLLAILAATDAAAQDCTDRRVQRQMTALLAGLDSVTLGCSEAAQGDLDGDREVDAVLLVTIQAAGGGNGGGNFLYVLLADRSVRLLEEPDGRRGPVDSVSVAGRRVHVRTREYREGDDACCPSGHGAYVLRVENGRLVRLPARDR
jgi:hypothetical protein